MDNNAVQTPQFQAQPTEIPVKKHSVSPLFLIFAVLALIGGAVALFFFIRFSFFYSGSASASPSPQSTPIAVSFSDLFSPSPRAPIVEEEDEGEPLCDSCDSEGDYVDPRDLEGPY